MKRNTNLNLKRIIQNSYGLNIYQSKKSYSKYNMDMNYYGSCSGIF